MLQPPLYFLRHIGAGLIIRLKVPAGNCGMSDMEETFGASKKKAR